MITIEDFQKVDIRVGKILRVEEFPNAKEPAFKLWIDFGELGTRTSSAQITKLYSLPDLLNTLVLAVTNFPPRRIADLVSEVLVLGVANENGDVVLVRPDHAAPLGSHLY